MGQRISGAGVGLPNPVFLYPTEINPVNTPEDYGNNYIGLSPGDTAVIPAGSWYITPGPYSVIQYQDPVTDIWRGFSSARTPQHYVVSDGFNFRVANLTGCPVAAVVVAGGSAYVQASTTVVPSSGTSTWYPIVGGALSVSTIANAGSGYGIAPLLIIPTPPGQAVAATGHCAISGGTVSTVTLDNVGAGYVTAPNAVIVPSPFDPNLTNGTTIVPATVTLAVVASGSITAVLCTNNGNSVSSVPTLTVAGAGTGATVAAVLMQTFTGATVSSSIGGGFAGGAALTSVGGQPGTTSWVTNPAIDLTGYIPRPMQALLGGGSSSLTSVSTVYDRGLFVGTPTLIVSAVGGTQGTPGTTATVTATYGGYPDTVMCQPAP